MTIFQKPNLPLVVAFVLMGLSLLPTPFHHALSLAADLTFVGWAVEELHLGVNLFRRGLGAVVITVIFMHLLQNPTK